MKILREFKRNSVVLCLSVLLVFAVLPDVYAQGKGRSDPIELTFAALPQEISAMSAELYLPLMKYMAKKTGKKVAFYMTTSYAAEMEAMVGGFVDVARLGPAPYVIGRDRDRSIEVFAVQTTAPGITQRGGAGYYGCLITKKGSGLTTIPQLRGKTLGLTDPGSTSGYLLPKVTFPDEKLGGEPLEKYFGKIVWTGRHDAAMLAVKEGRVDAAFTNGANMERAIGAGLVAKEDFNFLWWSHVVPRDPWVYRVNLKPELKAKIREAFFTFKSGEVEGADRFWKGTKAVEFIAATDSMYDVTRKLVKAKKELKKKKK
ncbi:MAG: phosphate/phosphite/phosphonate ABC transporter substrate-binding protein [bacterium]